jgi:prophage maintenance system killer protein
MALQYLTVQDVLWINLQATGKPQEFDYNKLEEATFYQYAYGESKDLVAQAARFLTGFLKKQPLVAGNEATGLVACLAFLKANHIVLEIADAAAWFRNIEKGTIDARDAIEDAKMTSDSHHTISIREAVEAVRAEHAEGIAKISAAIAK